MASRNLIKYLDSYKSNTTFNFIRLSSGRTIKYNLPDDFWYTYDEIRKGKSISVSLLEKSHLDYSIFRIDLDIKSRSDRADSQHLYTSEYVLGFIQLVHSVISEEAIPNQSFIACLFEKPGCKDGVKDGFHLVFPNLFVYNSYQNNVLVPKIAAKLDVLKPYLVVDSDVQIDKIANKPWIVNGCKKKEDQEYAYTLSTVFDKRLEPLSNIDYNSSALYSINRYSDNVIGENFVAKSRNQEVPKNYEFIVNNKILENLDVNRSVNYDCWINVGIVLYNLGEGSEDFLDLWKAFSERAPKLYQESVCEQKWGTFRSHSLSMGYLLYMLKQDNYHYYTSIVNSNNKQFICRELSQQPGVLSLNDHLVARVFCNKLASQELVYANPKWYEFRSRWENITNVEIERKLVDTMSSYFASVVDEIIEDKGDNLDQRQLNRFKHQCVQKLGKHSFLLQVIESMKCYSLDKQFVERLDSNKYLIACENGLLDLYNLKFRQICPNDFVSFSTRINYNTQPDAASIKRVHAYLRKVFPDDERRQDFIDIKSLALLGSNDEKVVIIAKGDTNGGKSQLVKFFETALGDYVGVFPKEMCYERKLASSGPRPELVRAENKRIMYFNEPSSEERMAVAFVKEISGGDTFFARQLYGEGKQFKPSFTLYMSCNDVPRIPQDDDAMWARIHTLIFESAFVDVEEDDWDNLKFPRISNLDSFFEQHASSLLWILFENYKRILTSKIKPTFKTLKRDTKILRDRNNAIKVFIDSKIEFMKTGFEKVDRLFALFTCWYQSFYPARKSLLSKDKFVKCFTREIGSQLSRKNRDEGWAGIVVKI